MQPSNFVNAAHFSSPQAFTVTTFDDSLYREQMMPSMLDALIAPPFVSSVFIADISIGADISRMCQFRANFRAGLDFSVFSEMRCGDARCMPCRAAFPLMRFRRSMFSRFLRKCTYGITLTTQEGFCRLGDARDAACDYFDAAY